MGKPSRDKGKRGEQELARIIRAAGFPCERTSNGRVQLGKGDLKGLPGLCLEVKRAERLDVPGWLRQVEADCPAGDVPAVAFRRNNEPWRAIVPFDFLLSLLEENA